MKLFFISWGRRKKENEHKDQREKSQHSSAGIRTQVFLIGTRTLKPFSYKAAAEACVQNAPFNARSFFLLPELINGLIDEQLDVLVFTKFCLFPSLGPIQSMGIQ